MNKPFVATANEPIVSVNDNMSPPWTVIYSANVWWDYFGTWSAPVYERRKDPFGIQLKFASQRAGNIPQLDSLDIVKKNWTWITKSDSLLYCSTFREVNTVPGTARWMISWIDRVLTYDSLRTFRLTLHLGNIARHGLWYAYKYAIRPFGRNKTFIG